MLRRGRTDVDLLLHGVQVLFEGDLHPDESSAGRDARRQKHEHTQRVTERAALQQAPVQTHNTLTGPAQL